MSDYTAEETRRLETALTQMKTPGQTAADGLAVLYDLMAARMLRAAFALTGSRADAEDALQDSLLKLYRQANLYTEKGHPQAYVLTVVRHSALDIVRRREQRLKYNTPAEEEPTAPPDPQSDAAAVADMLSILPEDDRLIVTLRLYENLSYGEIARIMKITLSAAQKRYQRAIAVLRTAYA